MQQIAYILTPVPGFQQCLGTLIHACLRRLYILSTSSLPHLQALNWEKAVSVVWRWFAGACVLTIMCRMRRQFAIDLDSGVVVKILALEIKDSASEKNQGNGWSCWYRKLLGHCQAPDWTGRHYQIAKISIGWNSQNEIMPRHAKAVLSPALKLVSWK